MQNLEEIKIDTDYGEQSKLLKIRYFSNLSWMDRSAMHYSQLGMANKLIIYVSLSAAFLMSVISLNIVLATLFSISLLWVSNLSAHYQALQERLEVLVQDVTLFEKQLNHAVNLNLELQAKLAAAFKQHLEATQHLIEAREEITNLLEKAKIKDQEMEEARQQIEASSQKIVVLTSSLVEQKKVFTEKMAGFFLFLDHQRLSIEQGAGINHGIKPA